MSWTAGHPIVVWKAIELLETSMKTVWIMSATSETDGIVAPESISRGRSKNARWLKGPSDVSLASE